MLFKFHPNPAHHTVCSDEKFNKQVTSRISLSKGQSQATTPQPQTAQWQAVFQSSNPTGLHTLANMLEP